jgi:hypothetical protein
LSKLLRWKSHSSLKHNEQIFGLRFYFKSKWLQSMTQQYSLLSSFQSYIFKIVNISIKLIILKTHFLY